MKKQTIEAIQKASERGMAYHVVSDQDNWIGGVCVGDGLYHTSWNSLELAKAVAMKQVNGVIYTSDLVKIN